MNKLYLIFLIIISISFIACEGTVDEIEYDNPYDQLGINFSPLGRVVFIPRTLSSSGMQTGDCIQVQLQLQDSSGVSVITDSEVLVSLAYSGNSAFYSDASCTASIDPPAAVIPAASSSSSVFYFSTQETSSVTITNTPSTGTIAGETIAIPVTPVTYQLSFKPTSIGSGIVYKSCTAVQIEHQDHTAAPAAVAADMSVNFTYSGNSGFYTDTGCSFGTNSVIIPTASSVSGTVYFKTLEPLYVDINATVSGGTVTGAALTSVPVIVDYSIIDYNYISTLDGLGLITSPGYALGTDIDVSSVIIVKTSSGNYSVIRIDSYTIDASLSIMFRTITTGDTVVVPDVTAYFTQVDTVIDLELEVSNTCLYTETTNQVYIDSDAVFNSMNRLNSMNTAKFYKVQ